MRISIAIPTYKRLRFLKRAVEDVYSQTYADWELVISDDEEGGETETWQWLKELAAKDPRVRIFKNKRTKHGQAWNLNNALLNCRGEWIKPFYDDDRMLPECLEKMVGACERCKSQTNLNVVLIGCRAQKWRNGKYAGDEKDFCRGGIDVIKQMDAQRAICMYDRWNGRTPMHMLMRLDLIEKGALMPEEVPYKVPVDTVWFAKMLQHGDYAMMRDVLVCQCEGEVASITGGARADESALDLELFAAYRDVYEMIPRRNRRGLTWRAVESQINGIRGIYHCSQHRFGKGMSMLLKSFKSIRGTFLTLRWFIQELLAPHCSASRRFCIPTY